MTSKGYAFRVEHIGEPAAGFLPYDDTILVVVKSGDPGREPGEFEQELAKFLGDWFDGAKVEEVPFYIEEMQ